MFNPLRAILAGFAVLLLAACGKEMSVDTLGDKSTSTTGAVRMKLDGVDWSADQMNYAELSTGSIVIFGVSKNKTNLVFSLDKVEVGEYLLNENTSNSITYVDPGEAAIGIYTSGNGNEITTDDGKVTITKIDSVKKTISGTFELEVYRASDRAKKTIIQGVIDNVSWNPEAAIPDNGGGVGTIPGGGTGGTGTTGNSITCKIDGTDFTAIPAQISAVSAYNFLNILGASTSKVVAFQMPVDLAVGDHEVPGENLAFFITPVTTTPSPNAGQIAESGKITITENNASKKFIKGTFAGKVTSANGVSSQVTNGAFSITYQ